jgi:YhcH/YjgK/YiaL family protein
MIFDSMSNASLYYGINPGIAKALRFLQEKATADLEPGKYEIDGSRMFVLVQQYDSRPLKACVWEAHHRYFDVQYVTQGTELMGVAPIERMEISTAYDESTDFALYAGNGSFFELEAGYFTILAPQDVHMACIAVKDSLPVKKLVVKVALDYGE